VNVPDIFLTRIVTTSLTAPVKLYWSISAGVLIDPAKVCPQSIGVWANTAKGNERIAPEIKIKIKDHSLDFDVIFGPPFLMPNLSIIKQNTKVFSSHCLLSSHDRILLNP
jgi:hypothetical protein